LKFGEILTYFNAKKAVVSCRLPVGSVEKSKIKMYPKEITLLYPAGQAHGGRKCKIVEALRALRPGTPFGGGCHPESASGAAFTLSSRDKFVIE
jgi:hypothetical protein